MAKVLWYLKRTGLLIMAAETLALELVNLESHMVIVYGWVTP
jgi:hypothetical protein